MIYVISLVLLMLMSTITTGMVDWAKKEPEKSSQRTIMVLPAVLGIIVIQVWLMGHGIMNLGLIF